MNGTGYLASGSYDMCGGDSFNGSGQTGQGNQNASYGSSNPSAERYDPSAPSVDNAGLYQYNRGLNFGSPNPSNHQLFMSMSGGAFGSQHQVSLANLNQIRFSQQLLNNNGFKANQHFTASHMPVQAPPASYSGFPLQSMSHQSAPLPAVQSRQEGGGDLDSLLFGSFLSPNKAPPPDRSPSLSESAPLQTNNQKPPADKEELWLKDLQISCTSLSLEPLSGTEVLRRVKQCMNDVLTRYIPCVDFLVECQQNLRKGLSVATQKRRVHGKRYCEDAMSPEEFLATYIEPLPHQFYAKTEFSMESAALQDAINELHKLVGDARKGTRQGCEAVKNSFLGGMKDGESWGLRKWLSRHGNALRVCTDLECLLGACKKLERELDTTRKLALILRDLAKGTLSRLKSDIPSSYQEVSAAHPYLPFFHRLEAALRAVSQFNPEEDAVICLDDSDDDDDEIEVIKAPPPPAAVSRKRKQSPESKEAYKRVKTPPPLQAMAQTTAGADKKLHYESSSGESEGQSIVEILQFKNASQQPKSNRTTQILPSSGVKSGNETSTGWPQAISFQAVRATAEAMAHNVELLAYALAERRDQVALPSTFPHGTFWDEDRFVQALRVVCEVLRSPDIGHFINPVEEDMLINSGLKPFSNVVKNPICLRDVVAGLIVNENVEWSGIPRMKSGRLQNRNLASWNMWKGSDLLQAVDLVFVNSLAYGKVIGDGRSKFRSATNKIRRILWHGITSIVEDETDPAARRKHTPTKRSETSGFVVYKLQEK